MHMTIHTILLHGMITTRNAGNKNEYFSLSCTILQVKPIPCMVKHKKKNGYN